MSERLTLLMYVIGQLTLEKYYNGTMGLGVQSVWPIECFKKYV